MKYQSVFSKLPDNPDKINVVLICVSGGRTSAFMAEWMEENKDAVANYLRVDSVVYVYVFANTGQEHNDSLRFVNDFDKHILGGQLVWVEAVINPDIGKGTGHRVVSFSTAARWDCHTTASPYHAEVIKYGIPNTKAPHCTREMKRNAITSYMKSLGHTKYFTAIGIRSDENRRVSSQAGAERIIYPLVDIVSVDKEDVSMHWEERHWDLRIPEHLGNCVTCFKKSDVKLYRAYKENPEYFSFFHTMEKMHGRAGPRYELGRNKQLTSQAELDALPDSVFYRSGRSSDEMLALFNLWDESGASPSHFTDEGGCSESCEIYQMDMLDENE